MTKWLSLLIFVFSIFSAAVAPKAQADVVEATVVLNEIRPGGEEIEYGEGLKAKQYVTLYNTGSNSVSLDGWALEYAKNPATGLSSDFCSSASWAEYNEQNVTVAATSLSGTLEGFGVSAPINLQLDDEGPGSLRLVHHESSENTVVQDLVGWGSGAPCSEGIPAAIPVKGKSLVRILGCDSNAPLDTDDNESDFDASAASVPGQLSGVYANNCSEADIESDCDKLSVTEILPNPAGFDAGKEFIEVHNPTGDVLSLRGCKLGLVKTSNTFSFAENESLLPGDYRAYFDSQTGIELPNAAGGSVVLYDDLNESVYIYSAKLKDNIAWAMINGVWQQTNRPTPNAANLPTEIIISKVLADAEELAPCPEGKYRNPETNRCKSTEVTGTLQPCVEGQERNPDTNRCRSIVATLSSLVPCKEGQERNPETNRCRSVLAASSSLTPCREGQERNPETNRCRKISSDTAVLKPCAEDQERSPDTNRCRKVQATLASATDLGGKKAKNRSYINYSLLGLAAVSAIGYGIYEYRHDFRYKLSALKSRFVPNKSGK